MADAERTIFDSLNDPDEKIRLLTVATLAGSFENRVRAIRLALKGLSLKLALDSDIFKDARAAETLADEAVTWAAMYHAALTARAGLKPVGIETAEEPQITLH